MATDLATAYIQLVPSAKGIKSNIEKELGDAGASAGQSAGAKIGSTIKKAIAAAGIGAVLKSAFSEGMDLQQNLGGTEAVFGEFADSIQSKATEAYKKMGMSASEYMATANKMGALFQGSGLDQQKSLDLTAQAMQRAADVASVMGLDTTAAMESIAGAAKGNFTMMDNLGVSMNATTLQAYALEKGINFEWNTADNAQKAELAMQMFFERTEQYAGNFERESAETLSGSLGAIKSAFSDLLGNLTLGNDIAPSLEALKTTVITFVSGNLMPALVNILSTALPVLVEMVVALGPPLIDAGMQAIQSLCNGLAASMPTLVPMATQAITSIVTGLLDNIPALIEAALALVTGLADGILAAIPVLIAAIPQIITSLVTAILAAIPQIIQTGIDLLTSLVQALPQIVQAVVAAIPQIIDGVVTAVIGSIPQIVQAGMQLFVALIQALPQIIATIVSAVPQIVGSIVSTLASNIPQIIQAGVQLLTALISNLPTIIATIVPAIPQIVASIVNALASNIPQIIQAGVQLFTSLISNLPTIIVTIVGSIPQIISGVVTAVIGSIPQIVQAGIQLLTSLIGSLPTIISTIVASMPQIISGIVSALGQGVSQLVQVGVNLVQGLWQGIQSLASWLWSKVSGWISSIWSGIKDFFGIHSPSTEMDWAGEMLVRGLANGITDNAARAVAATEDMAGQVAAVGFGIDTSGISSAVTAITRDAAGVLRTDVAASVAGTPVTGQTGEPVDVLTQILQALLALSDKIDRLQIVLDTRALVGGLLDPMNEAMGAKSALDARGVA